jgi:hypothetical protein
LCSFTGRSSDVSRSKKRTYKIRNRRTPGQRFSHQAPPFCPWTILCSIQLKHQVRINIIFTNRQFLRKDPRSRICLTRQSKRIHPPTFLLEAGISPHIPSPDEQSEISQYVCSVYNLQAHNHKKTETPNLFPGLWEKTNGFFLASNCHLCPENITCHRAHRSKEWDQKKNRGYSTSYFVHEQVQRGILGTTLLGSICEQELCNVN